MKLNPLVLVAACVVLAVAVTLFVIGQPESGAVALAAGLGLLVPSTVKAD